MNLTRGCEHITAVSPAPFRALPAGAMYYTVPPLAQIRSITKYLSVSGAAVGYSTSHQAGPVDGGEPMKCARLAGPNTDKLSHAGSKPRFAGPDREE